MKTRRIVVSLEIISSFSAFRTIFNEIISSLGEVITCHAGASHKQGITPTSANFQDGTRRWWDLFVLNFYNSEVQLTIVLCIQSCWCNFVCRRQIL